MAHPTSASGAVAISEPDAGSSLEVAAGHATQTGRRSCNEDFLALVTPHEPERSVKGVIAAIADGVSGNDGGRDAAEYTVRGLLADYYATPDTWPVTQALDRILQATNGWVQRQGAIRRELSGMATTLTALVLRGRHYHFAHVGDSRLYLLRAGRLSRLTTDHVWDRPEMHHVLTRAIGLDSRVAVDHGMGRIEPGDVFLLATDGVWCALPEFDLAHCLAPLATSFIAPGASHDAGSSVASSDPQAVATALVEAALAAGSQDNASALVLAVTAVPQADLRDAVLASSHLPPPPKLQPGQLLDGYRVEEAIHASDTTLLYRVSDPRTGRMLVLKTLHPDRGNDPHERAAFAHEEWLARRVVARFFPQVITPPEKNYLYYLTTWHAGHTLQQQVDAGVHLTAPELVNHGLRLARAVGALHRRSILHRDIKPANVHLGEDGELRLLDLGVAQSGLESGEEQRAPQAGTPSFLAPEQFDGAPPDARTDLYATGVTLYHAATRRYPYGEIEPFQRPRFGEPVPPTRYRPDLPIWLENLLLKAVARLPADRFETAEELLLALERGASRPLAAPSATPLVQRDPLVLWRLVAVASLVINLLLLYIALVR